MTVKSSDVNEIDIEVLDQLVARVEYAIEHDLSLSIEDMKLLLQAIHTLCHLQHHLEDKDITLTKLRKLLGMVQSSERRGQPIGSNNKPLKKNKAKSKQNKKKADR